MELRHDPAGFGCERVEDFDALARHRQETDVVLGVGSRLALTNQIHRILDRMRRVEMNKRYGIFQVCAWHGTVQWGDLLSI